jgi:uncharacterized NAD(P)/FAD-binding protein YdhS
MSSRNLPDAGKKVAVIGGGFTGSLFALKLSRARPDWTVLVIEAQNRLGRGLAYGACANHHVLNVPVSRMELGLEPDFTSWLRGRPALLQDALDESGGVLSDAFVPRYLFGDYVEQLLHDGFAGSTGLRRICGEAVALSNSPRQIVIDGGRAIAADIVVVATGNLPPLRPSWAGASRRVITDPWAPGALAGIGMSSRVLLVGTGLTMIDVLLSLQAQGHQGALHAISRHGLLPRSHRSGGGWRPVLRAGASPKEALWTVRLHLREAERRHIPWQRVFDAIRPAVASVWHVWTIGQKAQFLRHLRAIWDVHRHRMPARIASQVERGISEGRLEISAGRILFLADQNEAVTATIRLRKGGEACLDTDWVINCTGPQLDLRRAGHPLLDSLQRLELAYSDPLGLGLESADCALKSPNGAVSNWLYTLGPLTRPDWWEIVAVPEINAQVDRLVRKFAQAPSQPAPALSAQFLDMGAGI